MDLICCRNLLIYLEPVLAIKSFLLFHYATRPGGYVVLGSSEGNRIRRRTYSPRKDRAYKMFLEKKQRRAGSMVTFSLQGDSGRSFYNASRVPAKTARTYLELCGDQKEFDRRLLAQFAPATVFINEDAGDYPFRVETSTAT